MLAVIRVFLVVSISFIICIFGIVYCLFKPRDPSHVSFFGRLFGKMAPIFGIRVEIRQILFGVFPKSCVYIVNHQNNYDMVTVSHVVQPRTVTIGKRNLLWIPFFGLLYWLSGNFFIDRNNSIKSYKTLIQIIQDIRRYNMSLWMFPEGTRSRGKGLLPFKKGAFYVAVSARVPIVPICVSNITNKIKLNRWYNGLVIIEILSPINTDIYSKKTVAEITNYCYDLMKERLDKINREVFVRDTCSDNRYYS